MFVFYTINYNLPAAIGVLFQTISQVVHSQQTCRIQSRSILVMAVMASMQPESGWIIYARSGFPHLIQFRSSKKARIILYKTSPDPIWMAWAGFGQVHLVRKQAGVQESSGLILAEHKQPATSFPLSDSVALFHRLPRP